MKGEPEVLVQFDEPFLLDGGASFMARVLGIETPLGQWEGWLEFIPTDGVGDTITTERETTQPNRTDLEYWAGGLSRVFIQGALRRAVDNEFTAIPVARVETPPRSAAPHVPPPAPPRRNQVPVMDPFAVYAQGENVLRQALTALSSDHLRTLIDAYNLDVGRIESAATNLQVAEQIVAAVRQRVKSS